MRYIFLDTETGGVDYQKQSLLEAFFCITDEQFQPLADLHLLLKPDDGDYVVNARALEVNHIDLLKHDKHALKYKDANSVLYGFLQTHRQGEPFIPVGHNVTFDIEHIKAALRFDSHWRGMCSHRVLDTQVIARWMQLVGKLPATWSMSLTSLSRQLGISTDGAHSASEDVRMTMSVVKKLRELSLCQPTS